MWGYHEHFKFSQIPPLSPYRLPMPHARPNTEEETMSNSLFAVLAVIFAGFLGASIKSNSETQALSSIVWAIGFVLLCVAIGYFTGINTAKIMAACGAGCVAWLVAGIFRRKKK